LDDGVKNDTEALRVRDFCFAPENEKLKTKRSRLGQIGTLNYLKF